MRNDSSDVTASQPEWSVSGEIHFQDVDEPALNVTMYVRVQETGRADTSATTVAEQVLREVNIVPGLERIAFEVRGIPQNPSARYTIRVHADVDRDDRVSPGDYISTQSYPVEMTAEQTKIIIVARRVRGISD